MAYPCYPVFPPPTALPHARLGARILRHTHRHAAHPIGPHHPNAVVHAHHAPAHAPATTAAQPPPIAYRCVRPPSGLAGGLPPGPGMVGNPAYAAAAGPAALSGAGALIGSAATAARAAMFAGALGLAGAGGYGAYSALADTSPAPIAAAAQSPRPGAPQTPAAPTIRRLPNPGRPHPPRAG